MKLLDRLDRIVRPIAIPNLTEILLFGQVAMLFAQFADPALAERSSLVWSRVLEGEVWRLLTFFFIPPPLDLFVIFYFLLFMMMGKSLENYWGTVRYSLYFYLGGLLTILCALLVPDQPVTGAFFQATVFLAFATLNPNYELMIMFVLPVKVKWLAMLQAISYLLILTSGVLSAQLMVFASLGNYLLFFAKDLYGHFATMQNRAKQNANEIKAKQRAALPRHKCATCGIDSNTHPREDFRYCSKCGGELAYCEQHLRNHECVSG